MLIAGLKVGEVYDGSRISDVVVWSPESVHRDLSALRSLLIETPSGTQVALSELADVTIVPTPSEIKRESGSRRIDVLCNVRGQDLGTVARLVEHRVSALPFPRGYHPEFLGEYTAAKTARRQMMGWSLIALCGVLAPVSYTHLGIVRAQVVLIQDAVLVVVGIRAAVLILEAVLVFGIIRALVEVVGNAVSVAV